MTSATEAELAALYITTREAFYLRIILEDMGHKQSPTPLKQTMQWQKLFPMVRYNQNVPKRWICGSIGYAIENT